MSESLVTHRCGMTQALAGQVPKHSESEPYCVSIHAKSLTEKKPAYAQAGLHPIRLSGASPSRSVPASYPPCPFGTYRAAPMARCYAAVKSRSSIPRSVTT